MSADLTRALQEFGMIVDKAAADRWHGVPLSHGRQARGPGS